MFKSNRKGMLKVATLPEPVVKERIVVIGNSIRTLYFSKSREVIAMERSFYGSSFKPTEAQMRYDKKYWTDPRTPFELGGKDVVVTQVQGVLADDGQAYLLDVSRVIKVEK